MINKSRLILNLLLLMEVYKLKNKKKINLDLQLFNTFSSLEEIIIKIYKNINSQFTVCPVIN